VQSFDQVYATLNKPPAWKFFLGTLTANPGVNVNALRPHPGYPDIYE
jgi:hypothetical protein